MAKSKVNMDKLMLGKAVPVVKASPEAHQVESKVEEVVKNIHQLERSKDAKPSNVAPPIEQSREEGGKRIGRPSTREDETVRISVDMPKALFKRTKKKLVDLEISMIEYVNRLIRQDLEE